MRWTKIYQSVIIPGPQTLLSDIRRVGLTGNASAYQVGMSSKVLTGCRHTACLSHFGPMGPQRPAMML